MDAKAGNHANGDYFWQAIAGEIVASEGQQLLQALRRGAQRANKAKAAAAEQQDEFWNMLISAWLTLRAEGKRRIGRKSLLARASKEAKSKGNSRDVVNKFFTEWRAREFCRLAKEVESERGALAHEFG